MRRLRQKLESLGHVLESWGIAPRRPKSKNESAPVDGVRIVLPLSEGRSITVGTLTREGDRYVFRYSPDYVADRTMRPLRAFPSFNREFQSEVLWPFFAVRIPSSKRPEVRRILEDEQLDENDQIELLKRLGRRTVSNPFELRPLDATS